MTARQSDDHLLRRAEEIFYSLSPADQAEAVRLMRAGVSDIEVTNGFAMIDLLLTAVDRPTRAKIIRRLLKNVAPKNEVRPVPVEPEVEQDETEPLLWSFSPEDAETHVPDEPDVESQKTEPELWSDSPENEEIPLPGEPDFEQRKGKGVVPLRILIFYAVVIVAVGLATSFEIPKFVIATMATVFTIGLMTARNTSF